MTSVSMLAIDGLHGAGFQSETKPNTADQGKNPLNCAWMFFFRIVAFFFGHSFLENLQNGTGCIAKVGTERKGSSNC